MLYTRGWIEAEKIFNEEIEKMNNIEIDESISSKEYKIISIANKRAVKHFTQALTKITKSAKELKLKPISYK